MPEVLEPRDLMINKDKSEQHLLNRTNPKWRKSKYLGSMPETNKYETEKSARCKSGTIFDNKKLTPETKMRAFRSYTKYFIKFFLKYKILVFSFSF